MIRDHQCGFRLNRSTTDYTFRICHIPERKWTRNEAVDQPLIYSKKAYNSVRRKFLYNTVTEFGIPMEAAGLIRMCLNETYSGCPVGICLSDTFAIKNGLKQGDALSLLLFDTITYMCTNENYSELNGTTI
jgi:hypothetical protein